MSTPAHPHRSPRLPRRRVLGAACLVVSCAGLWPAIASAATPASPSTTASTTASTAASTACPALLDQRVPRLQDEKPQHLCQYAGKVLLVVNTASYCGYTSQFKGLEALNARYAARGLVVMGFPSNDFRQEDADAARTADVCFNTWGVQFPMFATGAVRGTGAQPLFRQLAAATGQAPGWNFNKYLVGRDGRPIAHYGSTVDPADRRLVAAIEQALAAPAPTSAPR